MNNEKTNKQWERLISLYSLYKTVFLLSEEINYEFNAFVQPMIELKDALDHIMRRISLDLEGNFGTEYGIDIEQLRYEKNVQIDKAIYHIARAINDTLDFVNIKIREDVIDLLGKYPKNIIEAILPEYYKDIRVKIETLPRRVKLLRERSDIGEADFVKDYEIYLSDIKKIMSFVRKAKEALPSVDINHKKLERQRIASSVFLSILSAILGALTVWIIINIMS